MPWGAILHRSPGTADYAALISSSKSGCRSSTLSSFTSATGGLVLPLSYLENALTRVLMTSSLQWGAD